LVEVGRHGGFSVNRLGLDATAFPLSFSVREASGSWMVDASAAQAAELADVLMRAAGDTVTVVGLWTSSFLDEDYAQWPPSRIAASQGTCFRAHPLGALASGVPGLSEEAVEIRRDDLPAFLAGWSPYELTLVDMPGSPSTGQVEEIALAIGTATYDEPVLPALPGSRLRYSGHDDCYFHVESADQAVPAALLSRLLALLAGSALAAGSPVDVTEPTSVITESLIREHAHWVGWLGAGSGDTVTVSLAAVTAPWRLSHPLPGRTDRLLTYDARQGAWRQAAHPAKAELLALIMKARKTDRARESPDGRSDLTEGCRDACGHERRRGDRGC